MATDIGTRPFWQSPPRAQPPTAAPDELDDLFNYDAENDQDAVNGGVVNAPRPAPGGDTVGAGDLGIDEEIKVRKPRAPIAKLDEDRQVCRTITRSVYRLTMLIQTIICKWHPQTPANKQRKAKIQGQRT